MLLALLATLVGLATPDPTRAEEGKVELALRPVDQAGPFFDVTMRPGETRTLEVSLANAGDAPIAARSYAADVYTIINGGFGARLRDEAQSGTTLWLQYPAEIIELPAGRGSRRTFTVAVPAGTAPGEYITSIILENEEPIRGSGDVALDQIVRQALAVVVTVPGDRAPELAIGAARHTVVAEKSVVAVVVENTGNVRLRPVAEFALRDEAGTEVSRTSVPMDTFYADTETLVEVPLDALLLPGRYIVRLTLEDAGEGVRVEDLSIPLVIEAPAEPATGGGGLAPALTEVIQAARDGRLPLPVVIAILAGILAFGVLLGGLVLVLRRRRHTTTLER